LRISAFKPKLLLFFCPSFKVNSKKRGFSIYTNRGTTNQPTLKTERRKRRIRETLLLVSIETAKV